MIDGYWGAYKNYRKTSTGEAQGPCGRLHKVGVNLDWAKQNVGPDTLLRGHPKHTVGVSRPGALTYFRERSN